MGWDVERAPERRRRLLIAYHTTGRIGGLARPQYRDRTQEPRSYELFGAPGQRDFQHQDRHHNSREAARKRKRRRIERGFSTGLWAEIRKPAEIRQPEPRKPDFGHPEEQLSGLHKLTSRERKNWTGALPSVDSTKIATPT